MAFNKEFALKLIEEAKSKLDTGQIFQSGSDEIAYYEWMICHNIISVTKHPGFYKTPIYIVHSIMPDYEERINKILGEDMSNKLINIQNITMGDGCKLNQNTTDNSITITNNITNNTTVNNYEIFTEIKNKIENVPGSEEVLKCVIEMEKALSSGENKSAIKAIFDKLLPAAANVATVWQVLSQYVPQLLLFIR